MRPSRTGQDAGASEVQKLPSLLNEVHDALAAAPRRWRFALTGSSARRLRREDDLGERPLQDGPARVLPLHAFARELAAGRVLRAR